MIYAIETVWRNKYRWIRGGLYALVADGKRVRVCRMTALMTDAEDLKRLVILSDRLGVPLELDHKANPQTASIVVRAARKPIVSATPCQCGGGR